MKSLLLLRHAKSDWADMTLEDHDRPLNDRGRESAALIGSYLAEQRYNVDLVICSSAMRTRETLDLMFKAGNLRWPVEYTRPVYDATTNTLFSIVRNLSDSLNTVMILGHNPSMQDMTLLLAGRDESAEVQQVRQKYPTGALAHIALGIDSFRDLHVDCGQLRKFIRPKDLVQDRGDR